MTFTIRMGVPDMAAFNDQITEKARAGRLDSDEKGLFKQWRKALGHLAQNPRHPGLRTHEIEPLSPRFGQKVFQSYLNQGDTADRLYWVYGPDRGEITVVRVAGRIVYSCTVARRPLPPALGADEVRPDIVGPVERGATGCVWTAA